jgi:hypothetical protein
MEFSPSGSLVALHIYDGVLQRKIEEIRIGDAVIGLHGEVNKVVSILHTRVNDKLFVEVNGTHISSCNHPHVIPEKSFRTTRSIKVGDTVKTLNGLCIVKDIKPYLLEQEDSVYSLGVTGSGYFVDGYAIHFL